METSTYRFLNEELHLIAEIPRSKLDPRIVNEYLSTHDRFNRNDFMRFLRTKGIVDNIEIKQHIKNQRR